MSFPKNDVAALFTAGLAVVVAYHIYAGPNGRVPTIPDVPPRGEFGSEIVTLAYLHTMPMAGLPLDTVLDEFSFYWSFQLPRSQADVMLNRLARDIHPPIASTSPVE